MVSRIRNHDCILPLGMFCWSFYDGTLSLARQPLYLFVDMRTTSFWDLNFQSRRWIFEARFTTTSCTKISHSHEQTKNWKLKLKTWGWRWLDLRIFGHKMFSRKLLELKGIHDTLPTAWVLTLAKKEHLWTAIRPS